MAAQCTWFMNILYRCSADYPQWIKKSGYRSILDSAKDTVRDTIKSRTGLMLDYVCSAGAKGDTFTDVKQARRFFSKECTVLLF